MMASGMVMLLAGFVFYVISKEKNRSGDLGETLMVFGALSCAGSIIVALWKWMP